MGSQGFNAHNCFLLAHECVCVYVGGGGDKRSRVSHQLLMGTRVGVSTTSTQLGWGSATVMVRACVPVGFLPTYLPGMGSSSVVLLWETGMVGSLCSEKKPMVPHVHSYV